MAEQQQNPDVAWAIQDLKDRAAALKRRRDYLDGRHAPVIPPAQTLSPLVAALLADLADNMMDDVVTETVDRLEVTNWLDAHDDDTVGDDATGPTAQVNRGALAQALWEANRGPARERRTYTDMGWAGDAYNIVERTPAGNVVWHPQDPRTMAVAYRDDAPDTIRVAAKVWLAGTHWRLSLYYGPDDPGGARLERYATKGTSPGGGIPGPKAFLPYAPAGPDGEPDDGARDWTRVPVFHFPTDETGGYGRSFLTPVIPLQDLLNKAVADLVVNMEDTALPQRWGTGIQAKVDPLTGEELPIRRRARQAADMITTASKDAAFGQFSAASMDPFMSVIQGWRAEIARKGYLPAYSVALSGGDAPSGLSLLVQEGRQIKRCRNMTRGAGWVWREQLAYMLTLGGVPTEAGDLDLTWAPVETRDEVAAWELLALKSGLGVPERQVLLEGGYDESEVTNWLEERSAALGGRVSAAGPGVASVTFPGVPGGMAVPTGGLLPGAPGVPAGASAVPSV